MDDRDLSPSRLLAPAALVVATLASVLVIGTSLGGSEDESQTADAPTEQADGGREAGDGGGEAGTETYEVQSGDTLDAIAEETGVSVEELQELNPDVDPQSLVTGQRLKLQE